ncbi:MAG: VWA domain-containing protein [Deltaproteobacteria bacterium]|nr:VWA domain-containing protein [Deltaproteobacteria bacterium]
MSEPRQQLAYWWALVEALGDDAQRERVRGLLTPEVDKAGLPRLLLDPRANTRQVLRAAPALESRLGLPDEDLVEDDDSAFGRALLYLKATVDVFGGGLPDSVTAEQYGEWLSDVRLFEEASGVKPGRLIRGRGTGSGGGPATSDDDVVDALGQIQKGHGLMAAPEIEAGLRLMEKRRIERMALAEVLKDKKLAAQITPSMAMVEQLLRQKDGLSGEALSNAKRIIRRFIDDLRDVLARDVAATPSGRPDRSVPPKRVFRNLDLKRTLWANLTNWDPTSQRLFVERLHFRHRAKKVERHRMVVVVDQSGSMVPAMVNCTILASIFAGLPAVDAHLVAYDTKAVDLSPWVTDPFEVLLRTQLGGGTDGMCVVPFLAEKIKDPRKTVLVWISDFYDNRDLLPVFKNLHQSGVTFIPVGSVSTSGFFSVDAWFRQELKQLGTPILSGSMKTLIRELKRALP